MDIAKFRRDLPAFEDAQTYPVSTVTFWSEIAEGLISPTRWGTMYAKGVTLLTGHFLMVDAPNVVAGQNGGASSVGGVVSSKSVGDVSVSYDTQLAANPNAEEWNRTTYGQQYARLARMFGAGCLQVW